MKIQLELTEEQAQFLKGLLFPVVYPSRTDQLSVGSRHKADTLKPVFEQLREVSIAT